MNHVNNKGFRIVPKVFESEEIERFRAEADRVATEARSVCVRRLLERSDVFRQLGADHRIKSIIPAGLIPVRGILFDKQSSANWPVAWHQDITISISHQEDIEGYGPWSIKDGQVHVQPPVKVLQAMITVRIHLDLTNSDNGALKVVPESHSVGRIFQPNEIPSLIDSTTICECDAGDVLLMSPLILHSSSRSKRVRRRRVIHIEYARPDALDPRLQWSEEPKK